VNVTDCKDIQVREHSVTEATYLPFIRKIIGPNLGWGNGRLSFSSSR